MSDDSDNFVPLPTNYVVQDPSCIPERNNLDSVENQYGNWLVNLCISKQMVILNGRATGDTVGNYTYYGPNGSSTIDYFIINDSMYKYVNFVKVLELTSLSDHCPLLLSYNLPVKHGSGLTMTSTSEKNSPYKLQPHIKKFLWERTSNEHFKAALDMSQLELDRIFPNKRTLDENDLNGIISNFNSYIFEVSKKSLKLISPKKKISNNKKSKCSFDSDCMQLKSQLKYKMKLMNRFPHNRTYRESYYKFRRQYRKTIKMKEAEYKDKILQQLEMLRKSDSKSYWSLLSKLKNANKKADTDSISPQEWVSYFKNLSFKKHNVSDQDFDNKLAAKEQENSCLDDLDYPITEKELHDQINRLKLNGSSSLDFISNHMIRSGRYYLTPFLLKLYNTCLEQSYFPRDWNIGLLTPLHKKGPKSDPGNFRGIAITSTLGKILTAILQKRLVSFLVLEGKLNENQSGFLPGHRTSDNIFILSQFLELNKKLNNPVFLAFIDFKKAFDTVWHGGLLFKLLNKGIGGKFYKLIKSIYNHDTKSGIQSHVTGNEHSSSSPNSKYSINSSSNQQHLAVKLSSGITEFFPCNIGVKQGDCLSPILFDCFIDDITDSLNLGSKFGFNIDETTHINSLLYADDLVIFSTSYEEMQTCLNKVQDYCLKWKLEVNVKKSKMMTIGTKNIRNFSFNNAILENVKSYTYLGISFSEKGLKLSAIELAKKAQKAWFGMKNTLYSNKIKNINLILNLFDTCIKPILTYGSETWGPYFGNDNIYNLQNKTENIQLQCYKWALSVSRKCSNLGVLGELGRTPILKDIQLNMIKYWLHLEQLPKSSLLYKVYKITKSRKLKWSACLDKCLKNLDLNVSETLLHDSKASSKLLQDIKEKLWNFYNKEWSRKVALGSNPKFNSKLRTYIKFKSEIKFEKYLQFSDNITSRELFTKLRLSDHTLAIESERSKNIKLENRICQYCKLENKHILEDEFHLVISCNTYSKFREMLFKNICSSYAKFSSLSDKEKFIYIMSYKSNTQDILKFIQNCFNKRKQIV